MSSRLRELSGLAETAGRTKVINDLTVYHGTNINPAIILKQGFKASDTGSTGTGVYVSPRLEQTEDWGDTILSGKISGKYLVIGDVGELYQMPSVVKAVERILQSENDSLSNYDSETRQEVIVEIITEHASAINQIFSDYDGIHNLAFDYITVFDPSDIMDIEIVK